MRTRPPWLLTVLLALPLVVMLWFAQSPERVEDWAQSISPSISRSLGFISSLLPISVMELLVYAATVLIPLGIFKIWKENTSFLDFLGHSVVRGILLLEIIGLFFYGAWGMNYARMPLETRLGLELPAQTSSNELLELGAALARLSNDAYWDAFGTDDLGRASPAPELAHIHDALELGFEAAVPVLKLEAAFATWRPSPKPILTTPIMARLQIVGFYSPFTGEANFLPTTPGQQLPHGLAHEKAHQRGIAPEDEANFIGFLVAALSPDPYCQYSGYLFAFKQVYFELAQIDFKLPVPLLELLHPGIQKDMDAAYNFWYGYRGALGDISQKVNDTYLKANGSDEGIETYNQSLKLILAWSHRQGTIQISPPSP